MLTRYLNQARRINRQCPLCVVRHFGVFFFFYFIQRIVAERYCDGCVASFRERISALCRNVGLVSSFLHSRQLERIPSGVMHNSQISRKEEGSSVGREGWRCRKLGPSPFIYRPPYVPTLSPSFRRELRMHTLRVCVRVRRMRGALERYAVAFANCDLYLRVARLLDRVPEIK